MQINFNCTFLPSSLPGPDWVGGGGGLRHCSSSLAARDTSPRWAWDREPDEMRSQLPRIGYQGLLSALTFLLHCLWGDLINLISSLGQRYRFMSQKLEVQRIIASIKSQPRICAFRPWSLEFCVSWASCRSRREEPVGLTFLLWIGSTFVCGPCRLRRPFTEARAKFLLWETRTCMLPSQFPSKLWTQERLVHVQMVASLKDVQPGTKLGGATSMFFRGETPGSSQK